MLVCRVGAKLCGLSLPQLLETMRPLPTEPLARTADFVAGLALIRGQPTPVVDARKLLGSASERAPGRYVTFKLGSSTRARVAALAVDEVVGVRDVDLTQLTDLPGLLRAAQGDAVAALAALDSELLLVLEHARLLPDSVWQELASAPEIS
jgi:purine-binding chemotaxis protein CheW